MRSNATFKQLSSALVLAITALLAAPMPTAGAVGSGSDALARGAAKPPPGTGINTAAARSSPGCDADAGPYGRYDFVLLANNEEIARHRFNVVLAKQPAEK